MERREAAAAATELLNQHRRLTARLERRVGRFEAEDLASEALARTLRRPPPDGSHQPWLERVLRNLVVDRARRSRSAAVHAAELSRTTDASAASNPEDDLLSAERQLAVAAALPQIPDGLREALVGRFYEERGYDDVAAARGISPATARTRVHRALAALRVSLGHLRAVVPLPVASAAPSYAIGALLPVALGATLLVAPAAAPVASPGALAPVMVAQAASRAPAVDRPTLDQAPPAEPRPARAVTSTPTPQVVHRSPPPHVADPPPTSDGVAVRRFDYDEDFVEGDIARPDGIDVSGAPTSAKHPSLIEIPREFVREIGKMIEDI